MRTWHVSDSCCPCPSNGSRGQRQQVPRSQSATLPLWLLRPRLDSRMSGRKGQAHLLWQPQHPGDGDAPGRSAQGLQAESALRTVRRTHQAPLGARPSMTSATGVWRVEVRPLAGRRGAQRGKRAVSGVACPEDVPGASVGRGADTAKREAWLLVSGSFLSGREPGGRSGRLRLCSAGHGRARSCKPRAGTALGAHTH